MCENGLNPSPWVNHFPFAFEILFVQRSARNLDDGRNGNAVILGAVGSKLGEQIFQLFHFADRPAG